ncbi:hypothetical protein A3K34_01835 [candidate division WWE3 bacterium RIFOXYC1_FULL_40_10]|nr:MAG: hypothetical protein A3K58_01835 [candidate division WWE3 bacterium RIFOXYB1_FULL_40_22]OGC61604.1 MAG: hypothetical protein A3K37_01835 [candidate division WWE3 bacterium RIFOXYA1_FULL_40_11]OGC65987.1 MAG: hypothetical protein A3K34_01835 [candidate division WWE3 bacterium RIFOXYC1_FULL_40_10]OGC67137.1 MAG: hypothetical protein A2450_04650 [candidate division WWE3 bacterium RIFOXYC2_FULL_40_11]OGC71057.1 MAG: hypothetical protein A2602_01005 [candidate division WWE3 bacterium RIFOXYD
MFKKVLPIILLLILGWFLKFPDLGYSEFQDDEKKALIRNQPGGSNFEFFMKQRKGPIQFLVTSGVLFFTENPRDEISLRMPFTILSYLSIVIFYLLLKEFIESELVSFMGAVLFLSNGFIVGFGRIAQYQNLNIFFSLLSLLMFAKLRKATSRHVLLSALGSIFFSISLLSHWDAIFYLVPTIYFVIEFFRRTDIEYSLKKRLLITNLAVLVLLILPFLIPYVISTIKNSANLIYFDRRFGWNSLGFLRHKFIFDLYNPFLALYFILSLMMLSLFNFRRNLVFILWFLLNFLAIKYLMDKPGTHIYNYVIPAIFVAALGISSIFAYKKVFYGIFFVPIFVSLAFLIWQSHILFIDHTREYPWQEKVVLNWKGINLVAPKFTDGEILTFGFPHFRNWKEINRVVSLDPEKCNYLTNEGKEISQIYMDDQFGISDDTHCYYIIYIDRPFNIRGTGEIFGQTVGKDSVYTFKNNGKKLARVYKTFD